MRAETKKKHKMGKRFAIVICVGAAGVMALGAQTAGAAATYNTRLTIENEARYHDMYGLVYSGGGKKCEVGRRVTLFKQQPGADRKIVEVRSGAAGPNDPRGPAGSWFSPPPKVRFLSSLGGACMPRRRPRCAMGSCAAATARRSGRCTGRRRCRRRSPEPSGNPPSKPPGCGSQFLDAARRLTLRLRAPKTPCSREILRGRCRRRTSSLRGNRWKPLSGAIGPPGLRSTMRTTKSYPYATGRNLEGAVVKKPGTASSRCSTPSSGSP